MKKDIDDDGDPIESLLREHDHQSTSIATQHAKDIKEEMKKIEKWAITTPVPDVNAFYRSTVGDSPAKTFPFELDAFQKEAIARIERDECVFVAAHTSAGKTVVAEYAFALAQKRCARAIYTSPIKTISNQKFRDFTDAGFDVGLLTGDVSVKPESSCLIMTTEILRSMLYRGADIVKDVEWVVFDEVHYVNDRERGVVWEEVIIMLPKHVGIVMLSATVPNVREFAGWVGKTKRKRVFVTGTTKRPVPLEHELYFGGDDSDKDFHLVGEKEQFLPLGYQKALKAKERKDMGIKAALLKDQGLNKQEVKKPNAGRGGGSGAGSRNRTQQREGFIKQSVRTTGGGGQSTKTNTGKNQWVELIRTLEKKMFLPMVVFAFSKRKCDLLADGITGVDLISSKEKHETHIFCEKALSRLSAADRTLPQVTRVRELLSRGLGVHHAGLLPIVKEIVEMLFCRGNVKVLFSTETFAMGVNAPARCVCFESLRKHDGQEFRFLLPGEYTQMAGRAGRRGKDTVGTVILSCWDNFPTENTLRKLLVGTATKLESQFRLTYAMILNVARAEDLKVEDVLARSFAEFHAQKTVGNRESRLRHAVISLTRARELISKEASRDPINWTRAVVCSRAAKQLEELGERANEAIVKSRGFREALGSPGRVVLVKDDKGGFARFAVALRVIKDEKDGEVKRSVVVMAINEEGHGDDFQDDGIDASMDTPDPKKNKSTSDTSNLRFVSRKKDEENENDDDMFGGFGSRKGKKGAKKMGGGGGGGGLSKTSSGLLTSSQPSISEEDAELPKDLPWKKRAGGFDYVVFVIRDVDIYAVTALKLQDVDAYAILDESSPPRKSETRAAATRVLSILENETKSIRNNQDDDTPSSSLLLQTLDPTKDLKITNVDDAEACQRHAKALAQLPSLPTDVDSKTLSQWSRLLDCERYLLHQIDQLKFGLSDANLALTPDFETKTKVLKYMGYLDEARAVTLKGRVACELSTGDELIGAEIVFGGCLEKLTPAEAAALLSALVFQEKNASAPDYDALPVNLQDSITLANTLAIRAGDIQRDFGLPVIGDDYCAENLKFGLSEVVYRWAMMDSFSEVCQLTDVPEGTIVRTITRLNETCRDVKNVARIIGDASLSQKMEDAMALIRRDIVFSASLYIGS
jgi:antiviral helicase SKI2